MGQVFGLKVLGLRSQVSGVRSQVSGFRRQVSSFRSQFSGQVSLFLDASQGNYMMTSLRKNFLKRGRHSLWSDGRPRPSAR